MSDRSLSPSSDIASVLQGRPLVSDTADRQKLISGRDGFSGLESPDSASDHRTTHPRDRSEDNSDDDISNTASERQTRKPRDAATASDDRATASKGPNPSRAAWVPTEDVITDRPDRQVLVVGDSIVGLTLTLILRQAGYDPVLVSGTTPRVVSRVSYLSSPAVRTLDAVGVGRAVRDCGTTVESVTVDDPSSKREPTALSMESERSEWPLVVDTASLRRALEAHLPEQQHGGDRAVETISHRDGSLVVEFGDSIREWFDVVVDAGGGGDAVRSARADSPTVDPLAQYEIPVETDSLTQTGIRDQWRSDALVQALPSPTGSGSVLRMTAPPSDVDRTLDDANWETVLQNGADVVSERADFEQRTVMQVRASDAVPNWWGVGRVAFCGPAACPVAPASGFHVTFGIEDTIALVTELNGATRAVSDVVDTYSSQRANRLTTLREAVEGGRDDCQYPLSQSRQPPLALLGVLRTVTLGSFLGSSMMSLQRDGFRAN